MGLCSDTRKSNFFCSELAVFLGNFVPSSSNDGAAEAISDHYVTDAKKFTDAIINSLKFVSMSPVHDIEQSKLILCRAVHSLIAKEEYTEPELFTTATYLKGILPAITLSHFVQIICSCDLFKQTGIVFSEATLCEVETLFQAFLLEKDDQYDVDSICSFLWSRWMAGTMVDAENKNSANEDLDLLIKSFQNFNASQFCGSLQNLCVLEVNTLEENLESKPLTDERHNFFTSRVNQLKHIYKLLEATRNDDPGDHGKFSYLLNKMCFVRGFISLIEENDLIIMKTEMERNDGYTALDFAKISIEHSYADSVEQFCFLLRSVCAMSESNSVSASLMDLVAKNITQFVDLQSLREIVLLTLKPSLESPLTNIAGNSLESHNVMQIRNLFFQNLNLIPRQRLGELLYELYDHLYYLDATKYNEWCTVLISTCGLSEARLTEVFNKLNRKELEDETSATFHFLLKSSFLNPDKVIEKAVNDAVASRGKTMLVEQLLEKISSLLDFSLRKFNQQMKIPYIVSAFAAASVTNINSACQFLQFLVAQKSLSPDVIFSEALIPKMNQNKVHAVKLLVTIAPFMDDEKILYISTLERFFSKQPQTSLNLENDWLKKFQLLGFEELKSLEAQQLEDNLFLSFRELLLRNDANKFYALTEFFELCSKSLVQKNYDLTKIIITEVPEFFTYQQSEVVVCAFKFLQKLSALDSRSLALCLKILHRENLVKLKQTEANVNIFTWKVLTNIVKMCLSCENASYPCNFIEGFMTILKGVLKWLHNDARNEPNEIKRQYLLLSFCIDMLNDVLCCSCLTLEYQPQSQVVFRDAFYLLVDQVQNYARVYVVHKAKGHDGNKNIKPDDTLVEADQLKRLVQNSYQKVVYAAKVCNYSLPGSFQILEID